MVLHTIVLRIEKNSYLYYEVAKVRPIRFIYLFSHCLYMNFPYCETVSLRHNPPPFCFSWKAIKRENCYQLFGKYPCFNGTRWKQTNFIKLFIVDENTKSMTYNKYSWQELQTELYKVCFTLLRNSLLY